MRLAASLLATLALSTTLASPAAEACGGEMPPPPAMFLVAQHFGRTFVLIGNAVPVYEKLDWKGETMSYDRSEIASAPALAQAMQLTLVGPKRARTIASRNQVFINPVFEAKRAMNALEIYPGKNDFVRIAIAGDHETTWSELDSIATSSDLAEWAKHPGFSPAIASDLYVSKVHGADVELISTFGLDGQATTYVRTEGGAPWGGYRGSPIGVVTVDGTRYMVLADDGHLTPIRV